MDTQHDVTDEADQPATVNQAELEASLERSAAQIAAGESRALGPVLKRLRASADRVRRERASAGQASIPEA